LPAAGTFPVCQTRGKNEIEHEGQRESKRWDEKEKTYFQHGDKEKSKHQPAQATVGHPRTHVISVNMQSSKFDFSQFFEAEFQQNLTILLHVILATGHEKMPQFMRL
jgi:hypothetical protein